MASVMAWSWTRIVLLCLWLWSCSKARLVCVHRSEVLLCKLADEIGLKLLLDTCTKRAGDRRYQQAMASQCLSSGNRPDRRHAKECPLKIKQTTYTSVDHKCCAVLQTLGAMSEVASLEEKPVRYRLPFGSGHSSPVRRRMAFR